ncbi:unnamed protein product [Symbiodinium pilosum]|uniref:RNA-binding S4 domain-containing protein n=1 Tax=Symbiodinium pilosum TaxID=2952 RepID=A0A812SFK4_SYMPI|nr:unnamed protein product [Symbiodinium pilosum]
MAFVVWSGWPTSLGPGWVTSSPPQPATSSRVGRLRGSQSPQTARGDVGILPGAGLGLIAAYMLKGRSRAGPRHSACKVALAARRRDDDVDPLDHLTPRRPDMAPGEKLFHQVYRSSMYTSDKPQDEEEDRGAPRKKRRRAAWLEANQEEKKDPAYGKKWVLDPKGKRRGRNRQRRWTKGEVLDEVQDIDKNASRLRTMYKRPRFNWKDVAKDDLRTSSLKGDQAAIGNDEVWLSKFLSHSGVCSRRRVTELVLQGRITINSEVVKDPVVKVDPKKDSVAVDGKEQRLRTLDELVWVMVHKPKDTLVTLEDPQGRKTIADLVPFARDRRLVPVGRLERNSTGLVLLTNDYEWATYLTHPRYEMTRTYRVVVYEGAPDTQKMQALNRGLRLPDQRRPCLPLEDLEVLEHDRVQGIAALSFTMKEGRYRQILRMFEYIGHPVRAVKRTAIGLVRLDKELQAGSYRMLNPKEIRRLKGSTILKRPDGDPFERQNKMQKAFTGVEDELDASELEGFTPLREDRGSRRRRNSRGREGGRDAPRRSLPAGGDDEDYEPQAASLEDLKAFQANFSQPDEADDEEQDWEADWIQQLDEMTATAGKR